MSSSDEYESDYGPPPETEPEPEVQGVQKQDKPKKKKASSQKLEALKKAREAKKKKREERMKQEAELNASPPEPEEVETVYIKKPRAPKVKVDQAQSHGQETTQEEEGGVCERVVAVRARTGERERIRRRRGAVHQTPIVSKEKQATQATATASARGALRPALRLRPQRQR